MNAVKTLEEWQAYLQTLEGADLREKTLMANQPAFIQELQGEGYSAAEIHTIFKWLRERFVQTGQLPPSGGYFELLAPGTE